MSQTPSDQLFHLSLNDDKPATILLLHGLMSSHREWAKITPYLSEYHLLIPDLPGHRSSKHLGPYNLSNASELVAKLIHAHAHGSVCHVVGFSGGGFIAVELAHKYPELIKTLFVSGVYNMASRRLLVTVAPYLAVPVQVIQCALPISVSSYFAGIDYPPALIEDAKCNTTLKLAKEGFQALLEMGEGYPLKARTLAVAGTKHDDVKGTRNLGEVFRRGNPKSRAVKIEGGPHGWGLLWPELFAAAIKAWSEDGTLPEKLEPLD